MKGRIVYLALPATTGLGTFDIRPCTANGVSTLQEVQWHILSVYLLLVCDATVANRQIYVAYRQLPGGALLGFSPTSAAITASQTKNLHINGVGNYVTGNLGADNYFGISYPIITDATRVLRVTIPNGVAGDALSGYVVALEVPA